MQEVINWHYPQLFSFALNPYISIRKLRANELSNNFWLPLYAVVAHRLNSLNLLLPEASEYGIVVNNFWTYICGSPSSIYLFKWLWKSHAKNKHKFFIWFLLRDRLNTKNLLRRKRKLLFYRFSTAISIHAYNVLQFDVGLNRAILYVFDSIWSIFDSLGPTGVLRIFVCPKW
jgi:hypothetical protein